MNRARATEHVYNQLAGFARGARELGMEMHPGITLVDFTQLSFIDSRPQTRAADIAARWGLDKSTVSRQIDKLVAEGHVQRRSARTGRRGQELALTERGHAVLTLAADSIRTRLIDQLRDWSDADIDDFARLLTRFNESVEEPQQAANSPEQAHE